MRSSRWLIMARTRSLLSCPHETRLWKLTRKDNRSFAMPASEHDKEKTHIPELDGIRGVAISLVLAFHFFHEPAVVTPGGLAWHVLAPFRIGWTGVDLFFVLSGFLIGRILLDARGASNYFRTFYTRRFDRILPLYAVIVCVCYLQIVLLEHRFAPRLSWMLQGRLPWFSYLFFVQNFWMAARNTLGTWGLGGTWSLAIEEQFYLTLPLLIWLFEPTKLKKYLIAAVIAAPDKWNDSKKHPETTVGIGPSLSSYFFRLCPKLGPSLFGRSTDPRSRSSRHHALLHDPKFLATQTLRKEDT